LCVWYAIAKKRARRAHACKRGSGKDNGAVDTRGEEVIKKEEAGKKEEDTNQREDVFSEFAIAMAFGARVVIVTTPLWTFAFFPSPCRIHRG
jgi:hypothetical protein